MVIIVAALIAGIRHHFDCVSGRQFEPSQIKLLAAPACRTGAPEISNQFPGQLDEHRTCIEESVGRLMRHLVAAHCAAVYFETFDAGVGPMDAPDCDETANRVFFRNFLSGMS